MKFWLSKAMPHIFFVMLCRWPHVSGESEKMFIDLKRSLVRESFLSPLSLKPLFKGTATESTQTAREFF